MKHRLGYLAPSVIVDHVNHFSGRGRVLAGFNRQLLGLWLVLGFVACFFFYPLCKVLLLSLTDSQGDFTLHWFRMLGSNATALHVLEHTVATSVLVSVVCLVIAYPAAHCLAELRGWKSGLLSAFVLFPFLSSSLVRTFVFIVLLGRHGLVNRTFEYLHIPGAPFNLLFNEAGVIIGMTYVLVPYMILSLVSSMKGIDRSLLKAGLSLGASRLAVYWKIYLPLTLPGVMAGSLITTILGFGYFVTPALMGGPRQTMLAQLVQQEVSITFNLSGAAALAVVMLVVAGVAYGCAARWLGLSKLLIGPG